MKRLLILPLLLLSGCGTQLGALSPLAGIGAAPEHRCSLKGEAFVVLPTVGGLSTEHRSKDIDALCAALKKPAVAASAPGV